MNDSKPADWATSSGDQKSRHIPKSALISAETLNTLLGQPELKIFDVRGTWSARALRDQYLAEHIVSAVFVDWTKEFIEPGVPLNLASVSQQEDARRSFERLGIHDGDHVVVYDDNHHMFAGRIWWAMRYWGFENVRVLDGGWRHWKTLKLPSSKNVTKPEIGSFEPKRQSDLRVSLEEFIRLRKNFCVLDGRGPKNYAGHPDDSRSGHIPDAINVAFQTMLDPDSGRFLDATGLEAVFDRSAPNWRNAQIISSCGSGYAGTVLMLALSKLGISTRLFDGSVALWKQDPMRPMEQQPVF